VIPTTRTDHPYREVLRLAVARAACEVRAGRCAAGCGLLTAQVLCERPACFDRLNGQPWTEINYLHEVWAARERRERGAKSRQALLSLLTAAVGTGAALLPLTIVFALITRWLLGSR